MAASRSAARACGRWPRARAAPGGLQVLEGDAATPDAAAAALSAMTLTPGGASSSSTASNAGRRLELQPVEHALAAAPPDTTIAFFARRTTARARPPGSLPAVTKAGGDVAAERNLKPWELPKWVAARPRPLALELDPGAACALPPQVGERQQRLLCPWRSCGWSSGGRSSGPAARGRPSHRLLGRAPRPPWPTACRARRPGRAAYLSRPQRAGLAGGEPAVPDQPPPAPGTRRGAAARGRRVAGGRSSLACASLEGRRPGRLPTSATPTSALRERSARWLTSSSMHAVYREVPA